LHESQIQKKARPADSAAIVRYWGICLV